MRRIESTFMVDSAYHKNTNVKTIRVNYVMGDTLRVVAIGHKDDRDVWLPYDVFAISSALTLDGEHTPFFMDRG